MSTQYSAAPARRRRFRRGSFGLRACALSVPLWVCVSSIVLAQVAEPVLDLCGCAAVPPCPKDETGWLVLDTNANCSYGHFLASDESTWPPGTTYNEFGSSYLRIRQPESGVMVFDSFTFDSDPGPPIKDRLLFQPNANRTALTLLVKGDVQLGTTPNAWVMPVWAGHGLDGADGGAGGIGGHGGFAGGQGKITFRNGDKYEGEFEKGWAQGTGKYMYTDGRIYQGEVSYNRIEGRGVCTWPDGRRYEGEYVKNYKEGHGIYYWPDGSKYDGQWKEGKQHGAGTFTNE